MDEIEIIDEWYWLIFQLNDQICALDRQFSQLIENFKIQLRFFRQLQIKIHTKAKVEKQGVTIKTIIKSMKLEKVHDLGEVRKKQD